MSLATNLAAREKLLRQIPSVDEVLARPMIVKLAERAGRSLVVDLARQVLSDLRARIARDANATAAELAPDVIDASVARQVDHILSFSLQPVINATGVILHTNLGRAPLLSAAIERMRETATQYSNLEYDLQAGARGRRDAHTTRLLARVIGAETAIVVNNNAAAVFLVLKALAEGGEVIVSRGELIEIGDGFRIPDIMAESGAVLREVGTTNRTRLPDYERAITDRTRLLLRVHPSNFRITGFTERPPLEELVELGRRSGLPVFEDLGSGCLVDLSAFGVEEPVAGKSLEAGASVISFSGDKLMGGPQAGIIAGKSDLIERIRRCPLFRALRVDKLSVAALEASLSAMLRGAWDEIPALRMIRLPAAELERRARGFAERLRAQVSAGEVEIEVRAGESVIGGGSTPEQHLPTRLITISSLRSSAAELERKLRLPLAGMPVLACVEQNRLVLDLRTVFPEQEAALLSALSAALC